MKVDLTQVPPSADEINSLQKDLIKELSVEIKESSQFNFKAFFIHALFLIALGLAWGYGLFNEGGSSPLTLTTGFGTIIILFAMIFASLIIAVTYRPTSIKFIQANIKNLNEIYPSKYITLAEIADKDDVIKHYLKQVADLKRKPTLDEYQAILKWNKQQLIQKSAKKLGFS